MAHLLLGRTLSGRYPRWGYLNRLETNAVMPRACVTTLAGFGLLALGMFLVEPLRPPSPPGRVFPLQTQEIRFLPQPLPPPPLVSATPRSRAVAPRAAAGEVFPVDDSIAPADVVVGSVAGAGGSAVSDVGTAPWSDSLDGSPFVFEPKLPRVDAFVAVEHEPELVFMQEPEYPELARDSGTEGTVLVRALVAADGTVQRALVLRGVTGLDEAALTAATTAIFRPARQQGLPVAVWVVIPIEFRLRG